MPVRIQTNVPNIMYKAILNCDICDKECKIPWCSTIEKALSISCLKGWVEDSDSVLYCPECAERKREPELKCKDCEYFCKADLLCSIVNLITLPDKECHPIAKILKKQSNTSHTFGLRGFWSLCECGCDCPVFVGGDACCDCTRDKIENVKAKCEEWISIQDDLPPIGSKIKAKYDNGFTSSGKVTRVSLDHSYRKGSIVVGYDGESSRYHITHWKPLSEKQLPQKTFELEKCYYHPHSYQLRYNNSLHCLAEMDNVDARGLCDWLNMILESEREKG